MGAAKKPDEKGAPAPVLSLRPPPQRAPYEFPVVLTPEEDGGYVVECPVIPGCISQGDTREEALANIRDAIEVCLANQADEGWELPKHVEITKVAV